ncbi:MAG: hypothetical protein QY326_07955 [Bdellovibrionota bacterium]|nr:MAG: hypothetical protein QY326_07955 [Bdellovibrionota bacterium]
MTPRHDQALANRSVSTPAQSASTGPASNHTLRVDDLTTPVRPHLNVAAHAGQILRLSSGSAQPALQTQNTDTLHVSVEKRTEPSRSRSDAIAEYLTGLKPIAPGVIAQAQRDPSTIGLHLVPPQTIRSLGSRERVRLRDQLVEVAASSESVRDCISRFKIQGTTPSKPALRILIDVLKQLHSRDASADPHAFDNLVDTVKKDRAVNPQHPVTVSTASLDVELHSYNASLLERTSYGIKALCGIYPKAGRWYRITAVPRVDRSIDTLTAEGAIDPPRQLFRPNQTLVASIANWVAPITLIGCGALTAGTAPYMSQSMSQIVAGGITGALGVAAAVIAFACHDRVERRAAAWFARLQAFTQRS